MKWAPRLKQSRLRRLYRSAESGQCDDELLQDVGWSLYVRCEDVVAASRGLRVGEVPCPNCRTVVLRKNAPPSPEEDLSDRRLSGSGWFQCDQCSRRLLWTDCREALRSQPRCFDCHSVLTQASPSVLECRCGKSWNSRKYEQSVVRRLWLPCPSCGSRLQRPNRSRAHAEDAGESRKRTFPCPKCQKTAEISHGLLKCHHCGHERQWRMYWKSLKKRDEELICLACRHEFRWQEWRTEALDHGTDYPGPAIAFMHDWKRCTTADERMMQVDILVQALHGSGALAPLFIDGDSRSIRVLLDQLSGIGACSD